MLKNRINGHVLAEDVVDPSTGEVLAEAGQKVDRELADTIQNAAVPYVWIQTEERNVKVLSSMMVDLGHYVDVDPEELGVHELVYYPVLAQISFMEHSVVCSSSFALSILKLVRYSIKFSPVVSLNSLLK